MSKIVLIESQLNFRGTSNSVYNYAKYLEKISGHTCYIAAPFNSNLEALPKFKEYFGERIILYKDLSDIPKVDIAYWQKYGTNDGKLIPNTKNVIHVVFDGSQPHGDKYVAISKWLGGIYNIPHVNYMVTMEQNLGNYRDILGIPDDAIVFGRHGGLDSFDDIIAHNAVYDVALKNPNIYFLFMNTNIFCNSLPNIIHIQGTHDQNIIRSFIETCDCGLHGRLRGETFGLSVAEFLYCNKPVICSINCPERNHIELMGDKGFYYNNYQDLYKLLTTFKRVEYDYYKLIEPFSPEKVIKQFTKIFLED